MIRPTSSVAKISFLVAELTFKAAVITSSVENINLFVAKINVVVAEIAFKVAVVTSLVANINFVVAEIDFKVRFSYRTERVLMNYFQKFRKYYLPFLRRPSWNGSEIIYSSTWNIHRYIQWIHSALKCKNKHKNRVSEINIKQTMLNNAFEG